MLSDRPSKIDEGLFLGDLNHANNRAVLSRLGVTHILTICPIQTRQFPCIIYKQVNVNDNPSARISDKFEDCIKFISNALGRRGVVLVHCYAGVSRSSAVTIAFLMKTKRMTFPEAFGYVRQRRPQINPNMGFINQLHTYSERLQRRY